jgi:hypothetical protein
MRCIRDPFAPRGSFMREVSSRRPLTSLAAEAEAGMILGGAGPAHHRRNYVNSNDGGMGFGTPQGPRRSAQADGWIRRAGRPASAD